MKIGRRGLWYIDIIFTHWQLDLRHIKHVSTGNNHKLTVFHLGFICVIFWRLIF